jgi:hypothetical protein
MVFLQKLSEIDLLLFQDFLLPHKLSLQTLIVFKAKLIIFEGFNGQLSH